MTGCCVLGVVDGRDVRELERACGEAFHWDGDIAVAMVFFYLCSLFSTLFEAKSRAIATSFKAVDQTIVGETGRERC